jgi:hypothetical protein
LLRSLAAIVASYSGDERASARDHAATEAATSEPTAEATDAATAESTQFILETVWALAVFGGRHATLQSSDRACIYPIA